MANIIDTLVVKLGLETGGFTKGTKDAEKAQASLSKTTTQEGKKRSEIDKKAAEAQKKRAEAFHKQAKQTAEGFHKIRTEALATIGIFTGGLGLAEFFSHTVTQGGNLYEMSQRVGMSARALSGWQGALEQLGGSAGEANGMIEQITQSLGVLHNTGEVTGGLSAYYRYGGAGVQNGMQIQDAGQYASDVATLLQRQRKELTRTEGAKQASIDIAQRAAQMGFSGASANLVLGGPAHLHRMLRQNESTSFVQSQKAARAMQHFRKELVTLKREFQVVGVEIMNALMPQIRQFLGALQNFARWAGTHQKQINTFFHNLGNVIDQIAHDANTLAQDLGGWKYVIEGLIGLKILQWLKPLAAAFGTLAMALGGGEIAVAVVAITGLVAALLYAYHKVPGVFDKAGKAIKDALQWEWSGLKKAGGDISSGAQQTYDFATHLFGADQRPQMPLGNFLRLFQIAPYGKLPSPSHSEVHIGHIQIVSHATDAQGVANDLHHHLSKLSWQANTGEH